MDTKKVTKKSKKKLIIALVAIITTVLLAVAAVIVFLLLTGKPSEKQAKKLIKTYLEGYSYNDSELVLKSMDLKANMIFSEYGEEDFDMHYAKKEKYLEEFYENHNFEDYAEAKEWFCDDIDELDHDFTIQLKEIISIKKSEESKKLYVIKARLKISDGLTSETESVKFYMIKLNGKYKIVDMTFA